MHILFVFVCLALLISMSTGQSDQSRRKTGIDMYFEQVKSFPPDISPNLPVSTSLPLSPRPPAPSLISCRGISELFRTLRVPLLHDSRGEEAPLPTVCLPDRVHPFPNS